MNNNYLLVKAIKTNSIGEYLTAISTDMKNWLAEDLDEALLMDLISPEEKIVIEGLVAKYKEQSNAVHS